MHVTKFFYFYQYFCFVTVVEKNKKQKLGWIDKGYNPAAQHQTAENQVIN